ncbi:MAG: hypothetical protein GY823_11655, partial [Flavobacteriaceae bacterium]|nr:hypothetical protein [Flavobacteriaceae bacterium]
MGFFFVLATMAHGKRARLSVEERMRRVVVPNKEGYSLNSIAKRLKIGRRTRRTVQEIVKKYAERGSLQDMEGRGRKRKTSSREDRKIIPLSYSDRFKLSQRVVAASLL